MRHTTCRHVCDAATNPMDVQHLGPVLSIFFQLAFELCGRALEGILAVGLLFCYDFGQARGVHFRYDFLSERECMQLSDRVILFLWLR